jgi:lysozyme
MDKRIVVGAVLFSVLLALGYCFDLFTRAEVFVGSRVIDKYKYDGKEACGIDVSSHQHTIDWCKVRKWKGNDIKFVYCRATGTQMPDRTYRYNFFEAKKNGLLVGSYHLFAPNVSAEIQFEKFIKVAKKEEQDLIPAVDLELWGQISSREYHKNLQRFLDMMENHYGKKPLLYSVQGFYNSRLKKRYRPYHLWIARYNSKPPYLVDGAKWEIWQKSDREKIKGIVGNVDIDIVRDLGHLIL